MFRLYTNVVIFAMNRRKPDLVARLSAELRAGSIMIVPSIVRFELEHGIAKSDRAADAREAADMRAYLEALGAPIGRFDYLIAARARRRRATLVTLNRRAFERAPGLSVTDWSVRAT